MITYEDFRKTELKIATIKEVASHPNADKLYVVKVDVGGVIKQVVAGIRLSYTPEALVGRQVVLVENLEPAVIRGVESQGMLLAASDEFGISVVSPDRVVKEGSLVK
jgi:methionine--tRNA ligase beta chain